MLFLWSIPALAQELDLRLVEREIVRLTNEERSRNGLSELVELPPLSAAARDHAHDMARNGYLGHDSPSLGGPTERVRRRGGTEVVLAENLFRTSAAEERVAQDAVRSWANSSTHRRNLLNPEYNSVGLGVARKDGRSFVTQLFAHQLVAVQRVSKKNHRLIIQCLVVEGPRHGGIFLNGTLLARWEAGGDGRFEVEVPEPGPGGKLKIGQQTSSTRYVLIGEIPVGLMVESAGD
ncbi:MAG: CAP domain-containing protein [Armatimonadetes bacterium]|nr:CAP domain-containing protein [Armatimonadota bacterium]